MAKTYDVVIIGSGSAGFSAAEAARSLGASVCLIEKGKLGGECPNYGCVPSKALLKTTKVINTLQHAREYGITPGNVKIDFQEVMGYQRKVVETITGGGELGDRYIKIAEKLKITIEFGEASFVDADTVLVKGKTEEKEIRGKSFVIATGSIPFIPPIDGVEKTHFLTYKEVLDLKSQPKSIAVIGSGPVGCEHATFFAGIGTHVTVIQGSNTVLEREEPEISEITLGSMRAQGIEVMTNTKIIRMWNASGAVYGVEVEHEGTKQTIAVERIIIATGNRAAIKELNLDEIGVAVDERRYIKTSKQQQTSLKHIFSCGDVDGGYQFTHTAHTEGHVAGYNAALVAQKKRSQRMAVDQRVVPRVTFVYPEVASVGMTSKEAKAKYKKILVGSYPIAALGRAVTENERQGVIKIIADAKTRKVVGGHMVGMCAGEVIHEITLAIYLNAKIDKLADMLHAYPTFSEAVTGAASNIEKQ